MERKYKRRRLDEPPSKIHAAVLFLALIAGCQSARLRPGTTQLAVLCPPTENPQLQTKVTPPVGWKADPIKVSAKHRHQVWLSPTGDTAYGVIYFDLPLPVGNELTLSGFLRQMKATEGEATLISKADDDDLPGIRFVAQGGLYKIRCNLVVHGFHGWAVYAGSLRSRPENIPELKIAELAREHTQIAE